MFWGKRYGSSGSGNWTSRSWTAAAFAGFAALALAVGRGDTSTLDLEIARRIQSVSQPWLLALMEAVSSLGGGWRPFFLTGLAGVGLIRIGLKFEGALCMATVGTAAFLAQTLKAWLQRPRPAPELLELFVDCGDASFPSGHAVFSVVFFGFLGWVAMRNLRSPSARLAVFWGAATLMVAVGASRVFLGAHWPTDVVAGYALGAFWLGLALCVYESLRRNRP